jgi:hypothetical protein
LPQTDPFSIGPQRRVLAANNGVEEDSPREEAMTVRVRRMEAQLETLLIMGLPEGSPPTTEDKYYAFLCAEYNIQSHIWTFP